MNDIDSRVLQVTRVLNLFQPEMKCFYFHKCQCHLVPATRCHAPRRATECRCIGKTAGTSPSGGKATGTAARPMTATATKTIATKPVQAATTMLSTGAGTDRDATPAARRLPDNRYSGGYAPFIETRRRSNLGRERLHAGIRTARGMRIVSRCTAVACDRCALPR